MRDHDSHDVETAAELARMTDDYVPDAPHRSDYDPDYPGDVQFPGVPVDDGLHRWDRERRRYVPVGQGEQIRLGGDTR